MEPYPDLRYVLSLQEEAACQEEKSRCGNHHSITCNVTWDKCTNKHHISIGCYERSIKDHPEVKETAVEFEPVSGYSSKCEALNGEEWEINY